VQTLKPLDKPPKLFQLAAFDLEGNGTTGPSSGALAWDDALEYYPKAQVLDKMSSRSFRRRYRTYAHNLTYDLGVLLPYLPDQSVLYMIAGDVYRATLPYTKDKPLRLYDSARLLAFLSIGDLGEALGVPKLPTPPQLLSIPQSVPEWYCDNHNRLWCEECYVKRDALVLLRSLHLFQSTLNELGGQIKNTLAASAMDLFRRRFLEQEYFTPFPDRNVFARQAYYGGRVEPFVLGEIEGVNIYDFTSLYPYVMRKGLFPHPNTTRGPTTRPPPAVVEDYEGCSEVVVSVPKMSYPPLPLRKDGKLYFPYGRFEGVWTHAELREAMRLGAQVLKVRKSLFSKTTCRPFIKYVNTLFNLRTSLKMRGDPREKIVKILLNALYGKFGQRQDAGLEKLLTYEEWRELGAPEGSIPVFYGDTVLFRSPVTFGRQPDFANTLWAAYIAAYARIELLRAMLDCPEETLYCDTDSLFTTGTMPVSHELGGLKLEHEASRCIVYGAKLYTIEREDGTQINKAKGVPKRVQGAFLEEGRVTYEKPLGFLEANVRHALPSEWIQIEKVIRSRPNKRCYEPMSEGGTGFQHSHPLRADSL
jgi:hypothetical protein